MKAKATAAQAAQKTRAIARAVVILGSEAKAERAIKAGITRAKDLYILRDLLTGNEMRTGYYQGSGRNTKAIDTTAQIQAIAKRYGRECVIGNDAPRGGVRGNWLRMLSEARSKQIRKEKEETARKMKEQQAQEHAKKMRERAEAIEHCLRFAPVPVTWKQGQICQTADLAGTGMIDIYKGCGVGTAYVVGSDLVAWHYGYQQPDNVPSGSTAISVHLSCTQVCFD